MLPDRGFADKERCGFELDNRQEEWLLFASLFLQFKDEDEQESKTVEL